MCRDGTFPQNPTKLDGSDTTILSHHPYILCHFANYALCLLLVYTEGLIVLGMEGCSLVPSPHLVRGRGLGTRLGRLWNERYWAYIVHVVVYGEWVVLWVARFSCA